MTRDVISVREARRLAAKLQKVNGLVWDAQRTNDRQRVKAYAGEASSLIKDVIEVLMDMHGQTDFYGNPTSREEIARIESEITL
jgi:hypothetical protein